MASSSEWRKKVDRELGRYRHAKVQREREAAAVEELERREDALLEAQSLAQEVAQLIQSKAHARIAEIVTRCLQLFEEPYEFRITFERKRGRTVAHLSFFLDGEEVDPLSASGGGCVDVAAFALRVACLILARPQLRRLLVLDEPFKMLSAEYRSAARALIESLATELGVQFVIVTHDPRLRTGTIFDLS